MGPVLIICPFLTPDPDPALRGTFPVHEQLLALPIHHVLFDLLEERDGEVEEGKHNRKKMGVTESNKGKYQ